MNGAAARRLTTALGVAVLAVLVAALISQLQRPLAPRLPSTPLPTLFSADYLARARAYRQPRELLGLAALGLTLLVAAWWTFSRSAQRLTEQLRKRIGLHRPLRAGAAVGLLLVISIDLVVLPLQFWTSFVQDGNYGFRTQGLSGWLRDWLVAHGLLWLGAVIAIPLAMSVARRLPNAWPRVLGLAAGAISAGLVLLAPLLLEPLWLSTTPLPQGADRTVVEAVVATADIDVVDIVVADNSRRSSKANAYVSGLGTTRRVVLFDTLLAQTSSRELALVVAHEVAHVQHRDLARGVLAGAAGSLIAAVLLGAVVRRAMRSGRITGPADARAVPIAALTLLVLIVMSLPVQSALSRRAEAAADWQALQLRHDPQGFVTMQTALVRSHLSDPDPPAWVQWLWGTHPTAQQRVRMAYAWAQMHDAADRPVEQ